MPETVAAPARLRRSMADAALPSVVTSASLSAPSSRRRSTSAGSEARSPAGVTMLNEPNGADESYEATARHANLTCRMTVHWAAALHMAPLEIVYTPSGATQTHKRRLVVQLPAVITAPADADMGGASRSAEEHEGGLPIVYENETGETLGSGWIVYSVGIGRARAQGYAKLRADVRLKAAKGSLDVELSNRWIERLQESTEEIITEAVGQICDVQAALVYGASQGLLLADIPGHPMPNAREDMGPQLMLRSVCSGADPHITQMYEELRTIVMRESGGNSSLLEQMMPDKEGNDENRPKAFYLVAIDLPGYGRTESPPVDGLMNAKLLGEIIRSLAKAHAFAIVAYAQARFLASTTSLHCQWSHASKPFNSFNSAILIVYHHR